MIVLGELDSGCSHYENGSCRAVSLPQVITTARNGAASPNLALLDDQNSQWPCEEQSCGGHRKLLSESIHFLHGSFLSTKDGHVLTLACYTGRNIKIVQSFLHWFSNQRAITEENIIFGICCPWEGTGDEGDTESPPRHSSSLSNTSALFCLPAAFLWYMEAMLCLFQGFGLGEKNSPGFLVLKNSILFCFGGFVIFF